MSWTMISESRGGLEVSAVALQPRAHVAQVDQVAVVGDGDQALGRVHADGLGIEQRRVAGGGVARVADGHVAGQLGQHVVGKDLRDQAHALDVGQMLAVGGGDAGRLLPAMLQRVEAEIGLARGVGMAVDGDDAALFVELVAFGDRGQGTVISGSAEKQPQVLRLAALAQYARDLIALADALRLDRFFVAGLSMGGQIALEVAAAAPDRLLGLILCDTFAQLDTPAEERAAATPSPTGWTAKAWPRYAVEVLPKMMCAKTITQQPQARRRPRPHDAARSRRRSLRRSPRARRAPATTCPCCRRSISPPSSSSATTTSSRPSPTPS